MGEYRLRLSGDGVEIDKTVDQPTALAILHAVMSAGADIGKIVVPQVTSEPSAAVEALAATKPAKPLSLREFVNEKLPKTNAEVILTIAEFLSVFEGKSKFLKEDIRSRFSSAGEALPKNFTRDFQTALDKGWIGESTDVKGSFFVTRTGETVIQRGFERN